MAIGEFVSILALLLSTTSLILSYRLTQKSNKIKYNARCSILISNYEDNIGLKIKNSGGGPLEIIGVSFIMPDGVKQDQIIYSLPVTQFQDFITEFKGRYVGSGEEIPIFSISDSKVLTVPNKEKIRNFLKNVTVIVDYVNIYDSKRQCVERKLSFFEDKYRGEEA